MRRTLILMTLLLSATGTFAEIYSWRDADGKVHYSDQAPTTDKSSVRVLQLPKETVAAPAPAKPAPRNVTGTTPGSDRKAAQAAQAANAEKERQAACDDAKKAMQDFQEAPRRTAVSSRGGKTSFNAVDGEERAIQEEKLQLAIDKACKP